MAQYKHLPIYRLTYELLQRVMKATKDFPREYKFTLGQKMKDESIELVVLIYRANSAKLKSVHIESLIERTQVLELIMRLSHDLKILPTKSYAGLVEMTESISRQATGWKKSSFTKEESK